MLFLQFGGLGLDDSDSETSKPACDECGKAGDLHCAVCNAADYCSWDCQIKAWETHKTNCKGGQASPIPPPPTLKNMGVVRGVRFDLESDKAGFTWIRYIRRDPDYVSVDLGGTLANPGEDTTSGEYEAPMWFDITHSAILDKEPLPCTLRVHSRDDLSRKNYIGDNSGYGSEDEDDGKISHVNTAIQNLKQTAGWAHIWKGPVIVYGVKELTADSAIKELVDIGGGMDLLYLMNFFNAIKDPISMITCIRLNCKGDVTENGRPEFESVMLPTNHAIFSQAPTQVSDRIEFPVVAARIPGNIDLCGNTSNSKATYLYRGCDPDLIWGFNAGYGWGSAPLTWDVPVGSCIVARKDKKPLLMEHAMTLAEYCYTHLADIFQEQLESGFEYREYQGDEEETEEGDDADDEKGEGDESEEEDDDEKVQEDHAGGSISESEGNDETETDRHVGLNREWVLKEISKAKFEEFFRVWKERQGSAVPSDLASPYA